MGSIYGSLVDMDEITIIEALGWLTAMLVLFVLPMIFVVLFEVFEPEVKDRISNSFFYAWFVGNIISIGYWTYTTGKWIDAFFLLICASVLQYVVIVMWRNWWGAMTGQDFDAD